MTNIGVYLSSKTDVAPEIKEATETFGQWLGRTHKTLVYGGSRCGMMEVLARAVKENGGRVFGVVPQSIVERVGTLDEVFTTAAAHVFGMHAKPLILFNVNGFWKPLIDMLDALEKQGVMTDKTHKAIHVANSLTELTAFLDA